MLCCVFGFTENGHVSGEFASLLENARGLQLCEVPEACQQHCIPVTGWSCGRCPAPLGTRKFRRAERRAADPFLSLVLLRKQRRPWFHMLRALLAFFRRSTERCRWARGLICGRARSWAIQFTGRELRRISCLRVVHVTRNVNICAVHSGQKINACKSSRQSGARVRSWPSRTSLWSCHLFVGCAVPLPESGRVHRRVKTARATAVSDRASSRSSCAQVTAEH